MKNKKRGFTLSEVLVTIAVIAFIAAILFPSLKNAIPNQSLVMFKKAYYLTERVVSELVNDDDMYPYKYSDAEEAPPQNFGNTDAKTINGETFGGNSKFCNFFSTKINIKSDVDCTTKTFVDGEISSGQFISTDNITYILPITDFASAIDPYSIFVDVNGEKAPNCMYNSESCIAPDRFEIKIYQSGRLVVDGIREKQYLQASNIKKTAEEFEAELEEENNNNNPIIPLGPSGGPGGDPDDDFGIE